MEDRQPDCVIVSSNRWNDIAPYRSYLFKTNPQLWGSVFPWEFPQHAERHVEEEFLRRFFDDRTIQMQGGAGTPERGGDGFKFLKQAWYECAFWNLEVRVPAVEAWYWAQPGNMDLLNRSDWTVHFLDEKVEVKTIFGPAEVDMYGENFLGAVKTAIQRTVRETDAKREDKKAKKESLTVEVPAGEPLSATPKDPAVKSAPAAQQEHATSPPDSVNPVPNRRATLSTFDKKQIPPVATSVSTGGQQSMDKPQNATAVSQDWPIQSRKRGNSNAKRTNSRGNHYPTRPPYHFTDRERNMQPFSPSMYPQRTAVAHGYPRGPSGGPFDFVPAELQGQPPMYPPNQHYFVSGQLIQPNPNPSHGMMHPAGFMHGQQPIYLNHNAYTDRGGGHFTERDFNRDLRSFSNEGFNADRGGHRRMSQGSRGGKSRGFNSLRGRGGRGRESFNSSEGRPNFTSATEKGHRQQEETLGASFQPKGRRGSVFNENWRSGNDHPQSFGPNASMKENVAPGYPNYHPGHQFAPIAPPQFQGQGKQHYPPNVEIMTAFGPSRTDSVAPLYATGNDHAAPNTGGLSHTPETTCGRYYIGSECTLATKLVAKKVPPSISEEELLHTFSQWAPVACVKRSPRSGYAGNRDPYVWIHFHSHEHARQFLQKRPSTWLNDQYLQVEVSEEYWNAAHKFYKNPVGLPPTSGLPEFKDFNSNTRGSGAPSILRRGEEEALSSPGVAEVGDKAEGNESADITPTPSGASTPKGGKPKKNKNKGKKKVEDLRKASLALSTDLKQQADQGDEKNDVSTAIAPKDGTSLPVAAKSPVISPAYGLQTTAVQCERSGSVQTEVQISVEPPLTPTEDVITSLPKLERTEAKSPAPASPTPTAPASEGAVAETVEYSESFRPFREDNKTEETKETENLERDGFDKAGQDAAPLITKTENTSKPDDDYVDDSFHTASGSPDSARHEALPATDPMASPNLEHSITEAITNDASENNKGDSAVTHSVEPVTGTSSEVSISPKTNKKAPVPHVQSKPKFVISTSEPVANPDERQSEQHSTSGSTIVPPTPAFITAPNTPAVGTELSAEDASTETDPRAESDNTDSKNRERTEEAERIERAEKAEKLKGPAQTQSLSLYGKKNEKKAKSGKKGTLKGKSKSGAVVASESSSRAVSGATIPGGGFAGQGQKSRRGSKRTVEDLFQSNPNTPSNTGKGEETAQDAKKTAKDEASTPQEETPTKRGKLGNLLSGIFGGGQQLKPSNKTGSGSTTSSSKTWLTNSKASDLLPKNHTKQADSYTSSTNVVKESATSDGSPSTAPLAFDEDLEQDKAIDRVTKDIPSSDGTMQDVEDTLGLGISNVNTNESTANPTGSKKKGKSKKRKSIPTVDQLQVDTTFAPNAERKASEIYRFGEGSSPQAVNQNDDRSEASSHTLGRDTPSSDGQSPTVTSSGRKLLPRPTGAGHLMEAKQPTWKKKRNFSRHMHEIDDIEEAIDSTEESNTEGQVLKIIALNQDGSSDGSEQNGRGEENSALSAFGPKRERLFVYLGAPLRDEVEDGQEAEQSREKLQKLAMQDIRRKRGNA